MFSTALFTLHPLITRKVWWVGPQSVSACKADHTYSFKFQTFMKFERKHSLWKLFFYIFICFRMSHCFLKKLLFLIQMNSASNWNINFYETKILNDLMFSKRHTSNCRKKNPSVTGDHMCSHIDVSNFRSTHWIFNSLIAKNCLDTF